MIVEDYGWKLDTDNAYDALFEFAEYFGTSQTLDDLAQALPSDELAKVLIYLFRMYDFKESSFLEK